MENLIKQGGTSKFCEYLKTITECIISGKCENHQGKKQTPCMAEQEEQGTAQLLQTHDDNGQRHLQRLELRSHSSAAYTKIKRGRELSKPPKATTTFSNSNCSTQVQRGKNKVNLLLLPHSKSSEKHNRKTRNSIESKCLEEKFLWDWSETHVCSTQLQLPKITGNQINLNGKDGYKMPPLVMNYMSSGSLYNHEHPAISSH